MVRVRMETGFEPALKVQGTGVRCKGRGRDLTALP